MQIAANTTAFIDRIHHSIQSVFAISPARVPVAAYSITVPGAGTIGSYATPEEAEAALHYLPFSARQQAVIRDVDGYAMSR